VGAALSPDRAGTGTTTSITTAAARPPINTPGFAARPPALAPVKHHRKAKRAKPKPATPTTQSSQGSAGVSGTAAQQTPVQPSGGAAGTGTSTTRTQPTKKQTTDTSTVEPPAFDEHTTSGQ
jgi:hypothetical protein